MNKYYWQCKRKNGSLSEGSYSFLRRQWGRLFKGEKFTKIALWVD